MRFPGNVASMFTRSARSISMLAFLAWLYPVHTQDNVLSIKPCPDVVNSNTDEKGDNTPCFLCHSIDFDAIGSKFPVFVDVHSIDTSASPFYIHRAHFACLAKHLAEVLENGEETFKCGVCGKDCSIVCFIQTFLDKTNKYRHGNPSKYVKILLAWLPLFLDHPVLFQVLEKYILCSRTNLLKDLKLAEGNKKLKPYLKCLMDKHNCMLFYHPKNILINKVSSASLEICSKRLHETTPGEISQIFECDQSTTNTKGNEVLARFFFHALEISPLPKLYEKDVLYGDILDCVYVLTNEQFIKFVEKGIISEEFIWRRYANRIEYLLESEPEVEEAISSLSSFSKVSRIIEKKKKSKSDRRKLMYIMCMIPVILCGINAKAKNGDLKRQEKI